MSIDDLDDLAGDEATDDETSEVDLAEGDADVLTDEQVFSDPAYNPLIEDAPDPQVGETMKKVKDAAERLGLTEKEREYIAHFRPRQRLRGEAVERFIKMKLADLATAKQVLNVVDVTPEKARPEDDMSRAENNPLLEADVDLGAER